MKRIVFLLGLGLLLNDGLVAQANYTALHYVHDDYGFASNGYTARNRHSQGFWDGFFTQISQYNERLDSIYYVRTPAKDVTEVVELLGELAVVDGSVWKTVYNKRKHITFFKQQHTIYRVDGKDTLAIFSLQDTLHICPTLNLWDGEKGKDTIHFMAYQGEGEMLVEGKKRPYWLFVNDRDMDRCPCIPKTYQSELQTLVPDMDFSCEIYLDKTTLLPLKKIVYLRGCKDQVRHLTTMRYTFQGLNKTKTLKP